MQHTIRGRTENQGQAVASITAHYGEIHRVFAREAMHFLGRLANEDVALRGLKAIFPGEDLQSLTGLIFESDLEFAEIHRDIAAVGKGKRLLHVDQRQSGVAFP